ncbi:hypothetical protein [Rathayibacter festucae]|uniref:hypothetical protein n=1 Tax=Rathayibacter festucae TaxID=110937 RepID=UPI002A6A4495|nr:hypothetical protein [Rathayibacter festucae]MDY0912296.1 hypothetical protein [Rathayibacter festucae]
MPDKTIARSFIPLDGTAAQACEAYFHVTEDGEPSAAAIERARTFLSNVDTEAVTIDPELAATLSESYGAQDPTGIVGQINAYGSALSTMVWDDLKASGFTDDSYFIAVEQNSDCAEPATS